MPRVQLSKSSPSTMKLHDYSFEVVPLKFGAGWSVRVTAASGPLQYISGFETEDEAESWITREARDWRRKMQTIARSLT